MIFHHIPNICTYTNTHIHAPKPKQISTVLVRHVLTKKKVSHLVPVGGYSLIYNYLDTVNILPDSKTDLHLRNGMY